MLGAVRTVTATDTLYSGLLAWCVLFVHDHAAQNAGISYYAVPATTTVLAVRGYVVRAAGPWRRSLVFCQGGL